MVETWFYWRVLKPCCMRNNKRENGGRGEPWRDCAYYFGRQTIMYILSTKKDTFIAISKNNLHNYGLIRWWNKYGYGPRFYHYNCIPIVQPCSRIRYKHHNYDKVPWRSMLMDDTIKVDGIHCPSSRGSSTKHLANAIPFRGWRRERDY